MLSMYVCQPLLIGIQTLSLYVCQSLLIGIQMLSLYVYQSLLIGLGYKCCLCMSISLC